MWALTSQNVDWAVDVPAGETGIDGGDVLGLSWTRD
jgi:hypothetical protein